MKKCRYCGTEYSDDVTFCPMDRQPLDVMQSEITSSRDKAPSAGFGIRALARIADAVFGILIGFAAGILAGLVIVILSAAGIIASGWQQRIHGFSLTSLGFALIGNTAYHCFCEGIHGATLGKLCCGICVVTEDIKPSNLKGAMIRSLAYYIDSLFFGLVGYTSMSKSPLNQRYGDLWGKTVVVKTKVLAPESQRTPTLFILGLSVGAGCWFVMLAIGLILRVV
jgi:uncharacterized RDD family membrane protein YckC